VTAPRSLSPLIIAGLARQRLSKLSLAAFFRKNPWPVDERRLMAHMLSVATGQIGNPIPVLILMKADNHSLHTH